MSNIAGKAYAMNVVTPIPKNKAWLNRFIFWIAGIPFNRDRFGGLQTLSLIHYAKWAIVSSAQFPRLDESQPPENLEYTYEFFFSNFNGSWEQYIDSFHMAIPKGLDSFWRNNVKYPRSVPLEPFHAYINFNQIWTNHYYNAYPMASANDVKSAKKVKASLIEFSQNMGDDNPETFQQKFSAMLMDLQHDLSLMEPTPIVSLSAEAIARRERKRQA
ncbi:MAG: hypothetical protein D6756_11380 [Cyanobacteria bacterium J083]|nr:MAG: hypothetical protein D6756_11380 [Cyanobacteria bacterium J083]